ncbi:hypothetical protein [Spirosoma endophyticum]|uniref:Uncharacterized protein n=1 Tax=Spirosoma endophyticum TaxID=662367 RepID=A0A1I1SV98_9BACT|nr:hypothetical protein [Spirosoma endophyticum]SFD47833.1 hypothetical protein SAMN05216167_105168 [Spirosoma endophyticum]
MDAQKLISGKTAVQAAKEAFRPVREKLPNSWLKDILSKEPALNAEPHLTRLKNIRLGRVAPTADESELFQSVLPQ